LFGEAFLGSFGTIWGFIEAYAYFELTWFDDIAIKSLTAVTLLVLSYAVGLSMVLARVIYKAEYARYQIDNHTFDYSLIETLSSALKSKNYAEVIRIGIALNRPLFESGNFVTRLQIGRIIEEAAARIERKEIQVEALIDSIGWSLVELGEYEEAKRIITHGIEIAQEIDDEFYEAKGYRHLGVIARRSEKFDEAKDYYKKSLEHAENIKEKREKDVLVAGINYAFASLYFYTKDFNSASVYIDKSITSFALLKDEYRHNMSLVTKGDIEFQQGKSDDAKDIYRSVLRKADKNTEKLQIIRSCLGLAEVYLQDHQWKKVGDSINYIEGIDLKDFKTERIRLDGIRSKLPNEPKSCGKLLNN